jgi:IS30 family transposase
MLAIVPTDTARRNLQGLSQISHQQLTAIEHALNHRPRKILNFHSLHEAFSALTEDFIAGVVLQP